MTDPLAPREFSAGLVTIGKVIASIQAPDGLAVTAENLAAQLDPAIAPEIVIAQITLALMADALEILGTQQGAVGQRWLGAPRAP